MQFCESWLCKLPLVSLSFILYYLFILLLLLLFYFILFYLFIYLFTFFVNLLLPLRLSLSLSLSLSIVMFEFEPLYKKRKRKKGERKKLFIYLFFFGSVWRHFWPACAYAWARMVRSGLLLLTRSCWMLYVAMVSSLFISVSQSPTSRCGLPSK